MFDDPAGCIEKIELLHDAGVRNVVCWMGVGGVAQEHVLRSMQLFADEVAPRFGALTATRPSQPAYRDEGGFPQGPLMC